MRHARKIGQFTGNVRTLVDRLSRTTITFHVLFAIDEDGDNVRVVTAYRPEENEWEPGFRKRKTGP